VDPPSIEYCRGAEPVALIVIFPSLIPQLVTATAEANIFAGRGLTVIV
jgi:hypothetical protein